MLSADLVEARARGGELVLRRLDAPRRAEARRVAELLVETARACEGQRRAELDSVWDAIVADAQHRKLAAGLRKLADDACEFESAPDVAPADVRRVVFTRASERRRAGAFDRGSVLSEAAASLGVDAAALERSLFADLRAEHLLVRAPALSPDALVEALELGQAQAVLLRAVRVVLDVRSAAPGPLRAFFSKLKFHKLLFTAERDGEGYRVTVDGPFSMFDAVTRYGLRLALIVPALRELDRWSLAAEVRWGRERTPLLFRLDASEPARSASEDAHLSDDVRELLEGIAALRSPWRAEAALALLEAPGAGVCIPDLVLRREGAEAQPVYVEVLGFWSRDAVFRRVELAERGLGAPVVFAASARLRVSPEVLGDDAPAALYVYKGKMSPRALLERADAVLSASRRPARGA